MIWSNMRMREWKNVEIWNIFNFRKRTFDLKSEQPIRIEKAFAYMRLLVHKFIKQFVLKLLDKQ